MSTGEERDAGATIFEVAEAAGVSITTVSHVFSGKRPVNERTRERVVAAAERLDYSPRRTAQALASGRTMTLAIQFPYPTSDVLLNPYFSELVPAMSAAAVVRGYAFVLVPPDPPRDTFLRPLIEQRGVDGAILLDPVVGDVFPAALAAAGVPFVSLGRVPDAPHAPRVDQDYEAVFAEVVAHLREQGYERPAFMNLPGQLTTLLDIQAAFEAAVPGGATAVTGDSSDAAADAAARRLLEDAEPDAVVCLSERQAASVYRTAERLDLGIPDDVGVMAFSDGIAAAGMHPPLTSLNLFPDRAATALIDLADRRLAGDDVPVLTLVPYALRPRASTDRGR